ncbi:storkhead-box protein 1 isoform X2 [Narcine bancroftii]|uniref:storkhead-box protein 1 isoform X2 n=1 Tax=Narcine bancroftii TaxID=1343680 RepID=UPI0038318115
MLVELTRSSLALVLGGAGVSASDTELPVGAKAQRLFAELQAENARSPWNGRLVRAVAELQLLGWLDCGALLVGGPASHLEVLREAWIRRSLRPPRGFRIRAVGDVSPIPMMPIAQSQFVPLTEVLCCVISEMNENHVTVTQESLMDYLVKCYPGIASPSQEILHNALGTLIRDRKVYHTEEGYFIVTSHTYFITGTTGQQSRSWMLREDSTPSPPPITYLVSVDGCEVEAPRKRALAGLAHCKSCCCFRQQELGIQDRGISRERPRLSVQHRATSTEADQQLADLSKAKEKGSPIRKFGFSLFRRSTKKESPKREYGTFSAQFPPEEWPVHNEVSMRDIPRDVELQIIKRINPGLTVDNLIRHTLLMKKLTRENTSRSGTSPAQRYCLKGSPQDAPAPAQRQRRARSARGKRRLKCGPLLRTHPMSERGPVMKDTVEPRPGEREQPEKRKPQAPLIETPTMQVYKRRINRPFSKGALGEDPIAKHHSRRNARLRNSGTERNGRVVTPSQCLDPAGTDGAPSAGEDSRGGIEPNDGCHLLPDEGSLRSHPEIGVEGRECRRLGGTRHGSMAGHQPQEHQRKQQRPRTPAMIYYSNSCHSSGPGHQEQERARHLQGANQEGNHEGLDIPLPRTWPDQTPAPVPHVAPGSGSMERLLHQPRQSSTQSVSQGQGREQEVCGEQGEIFTDDNETLYQGELDEDDACSSLYLHEDADATQLTSLALAPHPDWHLSDLESSPTSENWVLDRILLGEQPAENSEFCTKQGTGWSEASNESLGPPKSWCENESHAQLLKHQSALHCLEEEKHLDGCREVADLASSRLTYCDPPATISQPETHPEPTSEDGRNPGDHKFRAVHRGMKAQLRNLDHNGGFVHPMHDASLSQTSQEEHSQLETLEDNSITGDSGIDSPRTRASLASNNSIVLSGMKRQSLVQNYRALNGSGRSVILSPHPLLQLTPVMNV